MKIHVIRLFLVAAAVSHHVEGSLAAPKSYAKPPEDDATPVVSNWNHLRSLVTCNDWQYLEGGTCKNCPNGQVSLDDSPPCDPCPAGQVRGNAVGTGQSGCVPATGICGDWQFADGGICKNCNNGQVSLDNTAPCETCPAGQVRGNNVGTGQSGCVDASGICGDWQFAESGICKNCNNGQVSLDNTAPCETCPAGQVRGNAVGTGQSGCVPAKGICGDWQFAESGICKNCNNGQAALAVCVICPDGWVRGNAVGTGESGCVPASSICSTTQYANGGICKNCSAGKKANDDFTGCI